MNANSPVAVCCYLVAKVGEAKVRATEGGA
jgi:hypothetical protein